MFPQVGISQGLQGAVLLGGRAGGQVVYGGTGAGENLTLNSTFNATKGKVLIGSTLTVDEVNSRVGVGQSVPLTKLHTVLTDSGTNAVVNVGTLGHYSSGTPTSGFGTGLLLEGHSSTNAVQSMGRIRASWANATDASRKGKMTFSAFDSSAERDGLIIESDGLNAYVSISNVSQTVTRFALGGNLTGPSWTTVGRLFNSDTSNLTDSTGSGTIAFRTANSFGIPTLFASSSETLTLSANVYIAGAPIASTNVTQTAAIALFVDAGAAASIPLVLRGAASQSGAYLSVLNSSSSSIMSIDSNGDLVLNHASGIVKNGVTTGSVAIRAGTSSGSVTLEAAGSAIVLVDTNGLTFADAKNLIFNTTTGTKIGTATNQKLSLWNKAPDVQPTNAIAAAAFVANTSGIVNDSATFGGYTIGQIVAALIRIGALA